MSEINTHHLRLLEAVLFASTEVLPERLLARALPEEADLPELLKELQAQYAERGVNLVQAGKSWAFRTSPDLAAQLNRETEVSRKLSRAAVETLAIVAYHQPVTRAEIEEIRGVSISKGTLDLLFEHGWIRPRGRRKTPGRPANWVTTDEFLDHFGLEGLRDLPGMAELKAAGLLDSGPAINAYRVSGDLAEKSESNGADEPQPEGVVLEEESELVAEPLNPDDDVVGSEEILPGG
ncbi:MAG: SMC-Scp complex subunit ScpB [Rhodospirillaceae bacterium]|jgi:segregation and condensation protein B|nr:SMC-Scp complex subunit ScpB [Rhodospirillales bacterium]MBT3906019.1 SMC-Scp complex subunit ScpB [Rhodospirillaceae bacterium]MBT5036038.1 SMC-Scp complex subunit ScpB [Rhodospirillaceae bacterium]MBT6220578.1 SMC-Scp complex subunit ScpB [Rhodospirillaceae bacterium]MBT6362731.1 SMC-Scp complex subunit ScpB [Rhodospirillaceae bacterium]